MVALTRTHARVHAPQHLLVLRIPRVRICHPPRIAQHPETTFACAVRCSIVSCTRSSLSNWRRWCLRLSMQWEIDLRLQQGTPAGSRAHLMDLIYLGCPRSVLRYARHPQLPATIEPRKMCTFGTDNVWQRSFVCAMRSAHRLQGFNARVCFGEGRACLYLSHCLFRGLPLRRVPKG